MKGTTIKNIANILGIPSDCSKIISHFHIDSRLIEKGGLFFAIKGDKVDGHRFLEQVAAAGGVGAVVQRGYTGASFGLELLRVDRVEKALTILGKAAFAKRKEKVVAITGSMGKTTTKEFLATLLEAKYRVGKTPGNYNTQLTFPLTLLNLDGDYDVLVLEMGMSEKGQIKMLTELAPPDIAIVTRIAPAGIEQHVGGLGAVAQAKSEIFSHPKTQIGIISTQASRFKEVLYGGSIPKKIYGWKGDFEDWRAGDFVMEEKREGVFINDSPPISLSIEGAHLKENFLAAAAAARILGLSWHEIREKARELKPYKRRFEKIEKDGITFIQDCYNANPDSVCAALKNLPKPAQGRQLIGVLGTMPDLGNQSKEYHEKVGLFAQNHLDCVLSIGDGAKILGEAFSNQGKHTEHFLSLDEIREKLFSLIHPGDVVLIKGGNSLNLWKILEK